jgi:hypothetical protein
MNSEESELKKLFSWDRKMAKAMAALGVFVALMNAYSFYLARSPWSVVGFALGGWVIWRNYNNLKKINKTEAELLDLSAKHEEYIKELWGTNRKDQNQDIPSGTVITLLPEYRDEDPKA